MLQPHDASVVRVTANSAGPLKRRSIYSAVRIGARPGEIGRNVIAPACSAALWAVHGFESLGAIRRMMRAFSSNCTVTEDDREIASRGVVEDLVNEMVERVVVVRSEGCNFSQVRIVRLENNYFRMRVI